MPSPGTKKITIMGLGRYGGGIGVTRYLAQTKYPDARITITDLSTREQLQAPLRELNELRKHKAKQGNPITLRLGEHHLEDFTHTDLVIANPAVPTPWKNKFLSAAQKSKIPITTEIRLLVESLPPSTRTIAVTGTAGKSTTAGMIHHISANTPDQPSTRLGGNIGGSLLNTTISEKDLVILELSSAQLYWLGAAVGYPHAPGWSPDVAVLTNLAPNHLDWHETFAHYTDAKENIFRYQSGSAIALRGDTVSRTAHPDFMRALNLKIPGAHNQQNALLAAHTVHQACKINFLQSAQALRSFPGLSHRLQLIHEFTAKNQRFYNDSKATTPAATTLAVQAFDNPATIHLIAGGYDKKIDLTPISALAPTIAGLYTIGTTGRALARDAESTNAHYHETLENAVKNAVGQMRPGDILLLSPGGASWDQFTNFEERGNSFADLVRKFAT